mgnify:CR=1 FL=1
MRDVVGFASASTMCTNPLAWLKVYTPYQLSCAMGDLGEGGGEISTKAC